MMNILDIVDSTDITEIEDIIGDRLIIHHMYISEDEGVYIVPLAGSDEFNTSIIVEEDSCCKVTNNNNGNDNNPKYFMESLRSSFIIKSSIIYPFGFKIVNINSKVIVNGKFKFTYFIEHGIITIRYTKCKSN
jgi:hypothetical protein